MQARRSTRTDGARHSLGFDGLDMNVCLKDCCQAFNVVGVPGAGPSADQASRGTASTYHQFGNSGV